MGPLFFLKGGGGSASRDLGDGSGPDLNSGALAPEFATCLVDCLLARSLEVFIHISFSYVMH